MRAFNRQEQEAVTIFKTEGFETFSDNFPIAQNTVEDMDNLLEDMYNLYII